MQQRLHHRGKNFAISDVSALPRVLPYALFMLFIALATPAQWIIDLATDSDLAAVTAELWLYPLRILIVVLALLYFWPYYTELRMKAWPDVKQLALAVVVGIVVYALWVQMDWQWAMQSEPEGYNPLQEGVRFGFLLIVIRVFGAVVVVAIMEELFWRSFLARWLINRSYMTVSLGNFTRFSFAITVVLFGLEHHLWLAGMMAGAAYNLLLYQTRNLWSCIVAHALTNLILSAHVLVWREWHWW